jgi:hypothetical protein
MENLLDKFIRNEKKAKLWALLSLVAFFTTAATVVVVAYNIKQSQNGQVSQTASVITDTIFISKEDTATGNLLHEQSEMIRVLSDSCKNLQDKYQYQLQELDKYMDLLKECQNKPAGGDPLPPPPPAAPMAVTIYRFNVNDLAVQKVIDLVNQSGVSKSGYAFNTLNASAINPRAMVLPTASGERELKRAALQPGQKYYAGVKYFDVRFANEAGAIAGILNGNSGLFDFWKMLYPLKADVSAAKADIEVWLNSISLKTIIK